MKRTHLLMKCRYCGCTYDHSCPAGCGWAEAELCTVCAAFQEQMREYFESARRVTKASVGRILADLFAKPKTRRAK